MKQRIFVYKKFKKSYNELKILNATLNPTLLKKTFIDFSFIKVKM